MKKNLYRIKLVRNANKVYYVAAISPVEAIQIAQKTVREEEYVAGDNINMDILSCELVAGENEPRARFVEESGLKEIPNTKVEALSNDLSPDEKKIIKESSNELYKQLKEFMDLQIHQYKKQGQTKEYMVKDSLVKGWVIIGKTDLDIRTRILSSAIYNNLSEAKVARDSITGTIWTDIISIKF
mgnify:CR=1 FL=1